MAYGDYGAFVYYNGQRVTGNEDVNHRGRMYHGIILDGDLEVLCYKQGLPTIFYKGEEVKYYDEDEVDYFDFEPFGFEKDGYKFYFCKDNHYEVEVTTPNGDEWRCEYDYGYCAGFVW